MFFSWMPSQSVIFLMLMYISNHTAAWWEQSLSKVVSNSQHWTQKGGKTFKMLKYRLQKFKTKIVHHFSILTHVKKKKINNPHHANPSISPQTNSQLHLMCGCGCTLYSSTTYTTTILNCKLGFSFGNQGQQAGAQLLHATQPHPMHLPRDRINPQK